MNEGDQVMGLTPASWRRLARYWLWRHGSLPQHDFAGAEFMLDLWNNSWPHPVESALITDAMIVNWPEGKAVPPSAEIDFWVIRFWSYVYAQLTAFPSNRSIA